MDEKRPGLMILQSKLKFSGVISALAGGAHDPTSVSDLARTDLNWKPLSVMVVERFVIAVAVENCRFIGNCGDEAG